MRIWIDYITRTTTILKSVSGYQYAFQNVIAFIINSSPPGQMAVILADDIFKWIFLNEYGRIPIQISLKFVPGSPVDKKPALVQVMAWRRTGDKPLPQLMLTQFIDAYMRHRRMMSFKHLRLCTWPKWNADSFLCFCFTIITILDRFTLSIYLYNSRFPHRQSVKLLRPSDAYIRQ